MRVRQRRLLVMEVALPILAAGILVITYLMVGCRPAGCGLPLDDAWIHQTYARNLATTGQWAFDLSKPSSGSTSPAWTAALALGHAAGLSPTTWSYALGGVLLALTGWAMGRWLHERTGVSRMWSVVVGAGAVFEWHLVWAAVSGMEILALALLFLAVLALLDRMDWRPWAVGALIGVGVWIRPDALTILAPLAFAVLCQYGRHPRKAITRLLEAVAGLAILLVPYFFLNYKLSGGLWPNTFYAKQAEYSALRSLPLWRRVGDVVGQPFVGLLILLLPGLAVVVVKDIRGRQWRRLIPLAWVMAYMGLYVLRLPVNYQHGRYMMPAIPVILVLGVDGLIRWTQSATHGFLQRVLSKTWLGSTVLMGAAFAVIGAQTYASDVAIIETEMVVAAKWVSRHTEPEALLAAHDIGALGYYGGRDLLDLAGLVSPEVIPFIRDEAALHRYLDARGADYLVTFPDWYPQLAQAGEPVYCTEGAFSPAAGGENMVVYRWPQPEFARSLASMLYSPQPYRGRTSYGNHWRFDR